MLFLWFSSTICIAGHVGSIQGEAVPWGEAQRLTTLSLDLSRYGWGLGGDGAWPANAAGGTQSSLTSIVSWLCFNLRGPRAGSMQRLCGVDCGPCVNQILFWCVRLKVAKA